MRLLLAQPRWLGDVLLCTPALHALRTAMPRARIDFLTETAGAAVLEGNPEVDEVLVMEKGTAAIPLLRRIRRARYDAVVDFRSTGSTALAAAVSGAPLRIGTRGRGLRNAAYTRLLPRVTEPVYMARQKLMMLEPLGLDVSSADVSLRITIDAEQRRRAEHIWRDAGFDADRAVVAISAVSRMPYKQWGTAHWAAVADRLARAGAAILLTSGPGEREQAAAVASLMKAPAVWDYGATSVRELAAIYERCSLWLGNDGGPKHVAVAAGTPTLTVIRHGIAGVWTDPAAGDRDVAVEAAPPGSCPAGCAGCAAGTCFGFVAETAVADRALELLARHGSH